MNHKLSKYFCLSVPIISSAFLLNLSINSESPNLPISCSEKRGGCPKPRQTSFTTLAFTLSRGIGIGSLTNPKKFRSITSFKIKHYSTLNQRLHIDDMTPLLHVSIFHRQPPILPFFHYITEYSRTSDFVHKYSCIPWFDNRWFCQKSFCPDNRAVFLPHMVVK